MEERLFRPLTIAVTGPESTGKSSLSAFLAAQFDAALVKEYAREYLAKIDRDYTSDDLEKIAAGQIALENEGLHSGKSMVICDTELTVIRIWGLHRFGKSPDQADQLINQRKYDLYLLCNTDLPWEPDPLREHPKLRQYFFEQYELQMISRMLPYHIVYGTGEERSLRAMHRVQELIRQMPGNQ